MTSAWDLAESDGRSSAPRGVAMRRDPYVRPPLGAPAPGPPRGKGGRRRQRRAAQAALPGTWRSGHLIRGRAGALVDGVLRPHICLPLGIDYFLSDRELDAVLIHEVTHAKRRDNLLGLVHEIALCGLWFHPLVWRQAASWPCSESCPATTRSSRAPAARISSGHSQSSRTWGVAAAARWGSHFFSHRLKRLTASQPQRARGAASLVLIVMYGAVLLACMVETIRTRRAVSRW